MKATAAAILLASASGGLPQAMASPPTITLASSNNAASGITSGVKIRADTSPSSFRVLGSNPRAHTIAGGNNFSGFTSIDYYYPGQTERASSAYRGGTLRYAFTYTGQTIDLQLLRMSSTAGIPTGYRIWVDGEVTAVTPRNDLTAFQYRWVNLDFGSAATRRIDVEVDQFTEFGGVVREPSATVAAAPAETVRYMGIGDSYFDGVGTDDYMESCFQGSGHILGLRDIWNAGESGIGYLDDGSQSAKVAVDKLAGDITPYAPDWAVLALGCNDGEFTASQIGTAAAAYLAAFFEDNPDCGLTMLGPWFGTALGLDATQKAALQAAAEARPEFATGQLSYTDPTDDGLTYSYSGTQTGHPDQAGHDTIGAWIADTVLAHCALAAA